MTAHFVVALVIWTVLLILACIKNADSSYGELKQLNYLAGFLLLLSAFGVAVSGESLSSLFLFQVLKPIAQYPLLGAMWIWALLLAAKLRELLG